MLSLCGYKSSRLHQARSQDLKSGWGWGVGAISIAGGGLIFFFFFFYLSFHKLYI